MIAKFEESQFNRIFPFYILINKDLIIVSTGITLEKIFPETSNTPFFKNYHIIRPEISSEDFYSLQSLTNQLIILECHNHQLTTLRGQFEWLNETNQLLFIGSPWFYSMEQIIENKLSLKDFAIHDPMVDLLHVLKTQEITTEDLKNVLITVNKQKSDLKKAAKEIQDIALFPMQNPDPLIRIDSVGNILKENPAAERFTMFTFNGSEYSKMDFWRKIAKQLNADAEREVVEADSEDKTYSFVIKSLPHHGYYNIYGRDITVQKKNEEQIKLLAQVASANENGVLFTDSKSRIIYANEGYLKLTGYDFQDITGRSSVMVGKSIYSDNNAMREMRKAFYEGKTFNIEIIHTRKDGSWFWSRCKGQPTLDEKGKVINYFAMIEDITLEKERENQLNILSSIAAENTNGVVISGKDGKIEWVNKSFEDMTGYSLEEIKNTKPGKFLQGKDTNPETVAYLRKQIQAGEPFVCEILNYHRTGRPYWLRIQGQALKDKDNNIIKYFAIEEDITQEKETQQKLKEFESRFRLALEKIGDNVWEFDFQTSKTTFSNPTNNLVGYTFDETTDNNAKWWECVHPDDLHLLVENDRKCRSGETDFHVLEYRMIHKNGSIKWVLDRGVVIEKDMEGKPLKIIGTHTDITDQKNAEEAIKRKEEKYRNIIANINLGLLEVDNEDKIQYANQQFCIMSGYELEELLGEKATEFFVSPESKELIESKNELRKSSISDSYEVKVKVKSGKKRYWLISGAPNYDVNGKVIGSIGIHLDITHLKKLESQREMLLKNMAIQNEHLNEYAHIVSHDLKSPLRNISALLSWTMEDFREKLGEESLRNLQLMQLKVEKMDHLIENILKYSSIDKGNVASDKIDLNVVVNGILEMIYIPAHIKVSVKRILPVITADKTRFQQLFQNLISNAVNYTDKSQGIVEIDYTENDTHFIFSVKDNGIGIAKEHYEKIFKIFSTLGSNEKSTGIGLNIVKKVVELYEGEVWLESEVCKGTTFYFSIKK